VAPTGVKETNLTSLETTTLPKIDKFITSLVERLQNPNKAFGVVGSPSPANANDVNYQKCLKETNVAVSPVLLLRDRFGKLPEQYIKLEKIIDLKPRNTYTLAYKNEKVEFFNQARRLHRIVTGKNTSTTVDSCKSYKRLQNLFSSTTTDVSERVNFDTIIAEIDAGIKPFKDDPAEAKTGKETRDYISALSDEDAARRDNMLLGKIAEPGIQAAAKFALSKITTNAGRRKTYRKKHSPRKSRKVRRT
jgi:hypothetical protein